MEWRRLNGQRIDQIASALRHRRYTHIQVTAADGDLDQFLHRVALAGSVGKRVIPLPLKKFRCGFESRQEYFPHNLKLR